MMHLVARMLLVLAVALTSAAPSPATATLQAADATAAEFIGGCRAYATRPSYTLYNGLQETACDSSTPCRLCGDCETATFPSGMTFPRHNRPQFLGNAVWDGVARDSFGRLVRAMLGDPFAFVIAPEVDALRRRLQQPGLSPQELANQIGAAWSIDERYEATQNSADTRTNFLNALSGRVGSGGGLTAAFILNSAAWSRLEPPSVKSRIEAALRGNAELSAEEAMCAAVHMMDYMFSQRGSASVMNDLPSDAEGMSGVDDDPESMSIFEALSNATPSVLPDSVRDDPHNVIYTLPYEHLANGFYGGNVSVRFAPTWDGGSGIDIKWAVHRGCPMPGHEATFCEDRRWWTNRDPDRPRAPSCDTGMQSCSGMFYSTPDQGEMRTPHYKAPAEVTGLNWLDWNVRRHCIYHVDNPALCPQFRPRMPNDPPGADPVVDAAAPEAIGDNMRYDFTSLARPIRWSFMRQTSQERPTSVPMVYILAPTTEVELGRGVYGINQDSDGQTVRFTASSMPHSEKTNDTLLTSEHYRAPDQPARTDRGVPVWGMLYPCNATNLPSRYHEPIDPSGPVDSVRCEAQRVLARHREEATIDPLYHTFYSLTMPADIERELSSTMVWPTDATVDLGAKGGVTSKRPRQHVCVLSYAASVRLDGRCATDSMR